MAERWLMALTGLVLVVGLAAGGPGLSAQQGVRSPLPESAGCAACEEWKAGRRSSSAAHTGCASTEKMANAASVRKPLRMRAAVTAICRVHRRNDPRSASGHLDVDQPRRRLPRRTATPTSAARPRNTRKPMLSVTMVR